MPLLFLLSFSYLLIYLLPIHLYFIRLASLDDFWTDMTAAHRDETTEAKKFNIRMMDPWIKEKNYPILLVVQYSNSPELGVMNILPQNAISGNWRLPITYTTQTHLNFNNTSPNIWLNPGILLQGHFFNTSSKNDWIIFNLQQTGKY